MIHMTSGGQQDWRKPRAPQPLTFSATCMPLACEGAVAIDFPSCPGNGATLAAMAHQAEEKDPQAALKLASKSWSTGTLVTGMEVLEAQQVKLEDDAEVLALSAELQELRNCQLPWFT